MHGLLNLYRAMQRGLLRRQGSMSPVHRARPRSQNAAGAPAGHTSPEGPQGRAWGPPPWKTGPGFSVFVLGVFTWGPCWRPEAGASGGSYFRTSF